MGTPVSGATAYATPTNMIDRFDVRTLGELLSDSATPLDGTAVLNSTKLASLQQEASGMVEAACLAGGCYTVADLAALTGNSAQMMAGIVCRVTMFLLWERRPTRMAKMELPPSAQMAMQLLDQLATGLRAFGIQEVLDAYNPPEPYFMQPSDIHRRASITDQARRLFGRRGQYNVPGR